MKYNHETEEEFLQRQEEAKARGECVFRDDANREFILDLIDDYIDIVEAINEEESIMAEYATCKDCFHYCVCKDTVADENWGETIPEEVREMFSPRGCEDYVLASDMIEREIIEKARLDVINRMEELKNEWVKMSEYNVEMKYTQFYSGRADGIETGKRIVDIVLDNILNKE